jgi:hypothetical protein
MLRTKVFEVLFVMEINEVLDPINISLLSAVRQPYAPNMVPKLVNKTRGAFCYAVPDVVHNNTP